MNPRAAGGVIAAVTAVTVVAVGVLPVWPVVRVTHGGERVADLPDDHLTITYVHSIDRLPIEEDLVVRDGRLVVERTRLRQFGAGMGHIAGEGQGHREGDWWVVDDMGRDIGPELLLRVGAPRVDHRIRSAGAELALSPCFAGEQIRITPARVTTVERLSGTSMCEPHEAAGRETR